MACEKLFFVDKFDIKPILSPSVMPGIYKKTFESTSLPHKNKSNVIVDTRVKNGSIQKLHEFESASKKKTVPKQTDAGTARVGLEDRLWDLAYRILKLPFNSNVQFNRLTDELIYHNPYTKKRVVYRIIQPKDLQLNPFETNNEKFHQLGNPTFIQSGDAIAANINTSMQNPNQSHATKRRRGRPRKSSRKKSARLDKFLITQKPKKDSFSYLLTKYPSMESQSPQRSRYGRFSKPNSYIQTNFNVTDACQSPKASDINDKIYNCDTVPNNPHSEEGHSDVRMKRERSIPPEYRCTVCNKVYLGKNMLRHLGSFPDHYTSPILDQMTKNTSLYTFLLKKVQQPNMTEDQRITLLLKELTDFVNQLQSRRSQLVTHKSAIYFVNSMVAHIIGTPEGHYGVDLSALSSPPLVGDLTLSETAPARIDYNLSISLDDTITDAKLNLSENMMASDDSLLRTVDDLVKEGIKNLTESHEITQTTVPSVMHYDHASDNAVEAVHIKETRPAPILDLSLDLFQFSSN